MNARERAFVLHKGNHNLKPLSAYVSALPDDKDFRVVVKEVKPTRTTAQNAMLWALYDEIIQLGGEALRGWTSNDLHDFMLGQHFGWERHAAFGMVKQRPRRRSSGLSKTEFSDYVDSVYRFCAEHGIPVSATSEQRLEIKA